MAFHWSEKKAPTGILWKFQFAKLSTSHSCGRPQRKEMNPISERGVQGELTSLSCMALVLARTTSGESVMLVNFSCSGRVRYKRSLRSSWAFLALTTSTEPSVSQPMPRSHSKSDLYTFYKQIKGYWHCRDNSLPRELVDSQSMGMFKTSLDEVLNNQV